MDLEDRPVARRRRGAELERALLDAGWDELVEHGYAGFTIDAVAQRAGTSRPVIYRRWASKPELVRAVAVHALRRDRLSLPDTGSLRGDMISLLRQANRKRAGFAIMLPTYLGGYFQETGTSPRELRASVIGDARNPVDVLVDRAIERGEADPERATRRVRDVAFDLYRHEALMSLAAVPEKVIEEIVDRVFLPLISPGP